MHLQNISIHNFRCFRNYSIQFAPRITVLFGKNGSGKTTLIHAIHKALSMFMYTKNEYQKDKTKKKLIGYKTITKNNPDLYTRGFSSGDFNNTEDDFIEIAATTTFGTSATEISWKMRAKAGKTRIRPSEFEEAFFKFYDWHLETGELPLLSYISDSFPHKENNRKTKKKARIRDLKNFAYFEWDKEEGCSSEWINRLESNLKLQIALLAKGVKFDTNSTLAELKEEDKSRFDSLKTETNAITECFERFFKNKVFDNPSTKKFKFIRFALGQEKQHEGKLCIQTATGHEYAFRSLPSGYRRLCSIILDLAYRSFILSEKTSTDLPGIIIIDEIDLHLHPLLEQAILPCLETTFTKAQFIVSTHSPLVLAGIKTKDNNNSILKMSLIYDSNEFNTSPEISPYIYGVDYNQILVEEMKVDKRTPEIEKLFKTAWEKIATKDIEGAKEAIAILEQETQQDQIEIVQLRAITKRIEIIGQ